MASEEHLEILRKGVDAWNEWRKANSGARPDLTDASLFRANLTRANLTRASLDGAYLDRAYLRGVYLAHASLARASLNDANLNDANLRGAILAYADLFGAVLTGADLTGVVLGFTNFANIDLRQVEGLGAADHHRPSTIGTNTLERSHGQIPAAFLRGCGLPDWQIWSARLCNPDLNADERTTIWYEIERIRGQQPWSLSRVFISYTRNEDDDGRTDESFVEALEKRFDEKGVRYWRDVHDMKAGRVERQIDRAITLYPLVLLVLSERSVLSDWVEWEAAKARELEREHTKAGEPRDVLCPVALDDAWKSCAWPGRLRRQIEEYRVLDFSGWERDPEAMEWQFTRLYEGLVLNYGRRPRT